MGENVTGRTYDASPFYGLSFQYWMTEKPEKQFSDYEFMWFGLLFYAYCPIKKSCPPKLSYRNFAWPQPYSLWTLFQFFISLLLNFRLKMALAEWGVRIVQTLQKWLFCPMKWKMDTLIMLFMHHLKKKTRKAYHKLANYLANGFSLSSM